MVEVECNGMHFDERIFTHPVTGMKYKKLDGDYYFKTKWFGTYCKRWIKSGMKRGFVLLK